MELITPIILNTLKGYLEKMNPVILYPFPARPQEIMELVTRHPRHQNMELITLEEVTYQHCMMNSSLMI